MTVLSAVGEIHAATAVPLRKALAGVQDRGADGVVLDLSGVCLVDSTGLGVMAPPTWSWPPFGPLRGREPSTSMTSGPAVATSAGSGREVVLDVPRSDRGDLIRAFLDGALIKWRLPEQGAQHVVLVACELVAEVSAATGRGVQVALREAADQVLVEVCAPLPAARDGVPVRAAGTPAAGDATLSVRARSLVEQLAVDWGIAQRAGTELVWAVVRVGPVGVHEPDRR